MTEQELQELFQLLEAQGLRPEQEESSASNVESMMKNLFIDTSVSATQFRIAKMVVFRQCATFTQKFTQKYIHLHADLHPKGYILTW